MKYKKMNDKDDKNLRDFYPPYLRKEDFNSSNFRFLLPYVLENGKMYKRNECIKLLVAYHQKITGLKVNESTEQLGNRLKKLFSQNKENFKTARGVHGGWIYTGPSYSETSQTIYEKVKNTLDTTLEVSTFTVQKVIEAISTGDETLYVWWHPESEKLAQLEGRTEWAMKIGIHQERNIENRIEDYKTSIPYRPIFGLLVHCKKAMILEKCIHNTLKNRQKLVGEMGQEWFMTSVSEIEEILKFNNIIGT